MKNLSVVFVTGEGVMCNVTIWTDIHFLVTRIFSCNSPTMSSPYMWSQVSLTFKILGAMSTNKGSVGKIKNQEMISDICASDLRTYLEKMSRWKGLSVECCLLWFLRADLSLKAFPQAVYGNGFTPVWTFMCYFKFDRQPNVLWQILQVWLDLSSHFHQLLRFQYHSNLCYHAGSEKANVTIKYFLVCLDCKGRIPT